jgi:hypothetical protein
VAPFETMKKTLPNPPNPGYDPELLKVDEDVHSLDQNIFELDTSKAKPEELKGQHWWRFLRHYRFKDKTKTNGGCLGDAAP